MARFGADSVDNYGGQGGHGFFSLKNDKDTAKVRFMYDSIGDVEGYAVHQIEVDGKKKYVDCKREYNEPIDKCPLCKDGRFQQVKLFIPLYDVESGQVKIWERGKKFFKSQIEPLFSRYAVDEPLCSHVFEIQRNGRAGDQSTTYSIFDMPKLQDNTTLEDLPEVPKILGGLVLDKTPEEMEYFLKHNGRFEDGETEELPMRRSDAVTERRTPSRGDRF